MVDYTAEDAPQHGMKRLIKTKFSVLINPPHLTIIMSN
jgi:hypothetical protein